MALFITFICLSFLIIYIICSSENNSNKINKNDNIIKGIVGEELICNEIEKNLDIYYKIIRNVYIYKDDNKTEIDIILITTTGIFVIESKNYNGYIYGEEKDYNWTQFIKKGTTYQRMNPIRQNNYHIKFLSQYLNKPEDDFKSYVVFSDNAKLSKINYNHKKSRVINTKHLILYLINDIHDSNIIYTHEEIDKIYIDLKYYNEHSNINYKINN